METLEFLRAVLPTSGLYCVCDVIGPKKPHFFVSTIEEMVPAAEALINKQQHVFFACGTFVKPGTRSADNALSMKSLFIDMDCGKGKAFSSQKDAATRLEAFCNEVGLPAPWVVSSGSGVHAYWPFTASVDITEWRGVAENFKRLCVEKKLPIDFTCTSDAARVLRWPGSMNWKNKKNPKPCEIKFVPPQQCHELQELSRIILQALPKQLHISLVAKTSLDDLPGERPKEKRQPSNVKALENRVTFFKQIVEKSAAGNGCAQVAHYLAHAADDGMEPLWRGMLSLAQCCEDGEKSCRKLSEMHPYTEARMRQKMREIKGPYPCTKLDSENPGICTTCKFWGKITNPLHFGHDIAVDTEEKEIALPTSSPEIIPATVVRPVPPRGYAYGTKGGVYRQVMETNTEGDEIVSNKQILPYDLFVVDILNGGDEGHLVQLMAMRPEGPTSVLIPQKTIVSRDETVKSLATQNVVASYGAGNDRHLFDYVRACVGEMSSIRRATPVPDHFGWQMDGTFVYNSKIYTPAGEKFVPMPRLQNITARTYQSGTLEKWREIVELFIAKERFESLAVMLLGFGSPLMHFTPFAGLTVHMGSTESGTGKTLALKLAASVWGPESYIGHAQSSAVLHTHRQGDLGSLPLIIDEITNANDNFQFLEYFVLEMTLGQGKDRMKAATNEERINTTSWKALQLLSSNQHATDFFIAVRDKAPEGHLRRLLELKLTEELKWNYDETLLIQSLSENYGTAGHRFVQWLVRNPSTAREVTQKVIRGLMREVANTENIGNERFWFNGIGCCVAAGILIGSAYANIVDLPISDISGVFTDMLKEARSIVGSNKRSAEDILNSYTREYYGQFIVVEKNAATHQFETTYGNGGIIDKSITRTQIKGRIEKGVTPGYVHYFIEEQMLRKWCAERNYGYSDFRRNLSKYFVVKEGRKDLLSKTRGPMMRSLVLMVTTPETQNVEDFDEQLDSTQSVEERSA